MDLYLDGHIHANITYAVCKIYVLSKACAHTSPQQIRCYLKATSGKGLIMKPSEKLFKIDSFPDANFVGMHRYEAMDDPVCVKSRTGCVIIVGNLPIMW